MLIRLCALMLVLASGRGQKEDQNWEIAVVMNDEIDLLSSDGSIIDKTFNNFTKLKALTFDNVRHQFVVSDMDQKKNDTIFTVQHTKETDNITPIVKNLPDDILGLAIDPIADVLYWTDSKNKAISYLNLSDPDAKSQTFLSLPYQSPQDVTIDVCRRQIYWSNSNRTHPTIERASLDGTQRTSLIISDLHRPRGIAIDHKEQRFYWADIRDGINRRIESANLEGKERELVHEATFFAPFGLAVDSDAVYWTDVTGKILWKMPKKPTKDGAVNHPEKIHVFQGEPLGIVTRNMMDPTLPDCDDLARAVKLYNESNVEIAPEKPEPVATCLNRGVLVEGACRCPPGFNGTFCEFPYCNNFCLRGECSFSQGAPRCKCPLGFAGLRCETDSCEGFCLNGGICRVDGRNPSCSCQRNFAGLRCEVSVRSVDICRVFCEQPENDDLSIESEEFHCRCDKGAFTFSTNNGTSAESLQMKVAEGYASLSRFGDPVFLVLSCMVVILFVVIVVLSVLTCARKRPRATRVKKRIIVNKNVTPLTYRAPPTEQCEITIENCCNMNVCETPCFDPPQLRNFQPKPDDKKTLLSNMENGEDLY